MLFHVKDEYYYRLIDGITLAHVRFLNHPTNKYENQDTISKLFLLKKTKVHH